MPTPANPVVYHLHGHTLPDSLVLTEDDYLSFLANIARNPKLLPGPIQRALDRSTCLFIGYRLADWNFRVLFQGLRPRLKFLNIAILKPSDDSERAREQRDYLNSYYASMDLQVYWGTAKGILRLRTAGSVGRNGNDRGLSRAIFARQMRPIACWRSCRAAGLRDDGRRLSYLVVCLHRDSHRGDIGRVQAGLRSLAHVSKREGVGIRNLRKVGRVFVVEACRVPAERLQRRGFAEELLGRYQFSLGPAPNGFPVFGFVSGLPIKP